RDRRLADALAGDEHLVGRKRRHVRHLAGADGHTGDALAETQVIGGVHLDDDGLGLGGVDALGGECRNNRQESKGSLSGHCTSRSCRCARARRPERCGPCPPFASPPPTPSPPSSARRSAPPPSGGGSAPGAARRPPGPGRMRRTSAEWPPWYRPWR